MRSSLPLAAALAAALLRGGRCRATAPVAASAAASASPSAARSLASWGIGGTGGGGGDDGGGDRVGGGGKGFDADSAPTPNALFSAAAASLAEHAVREALRDPLSALMAGTGVPLGIRLPRPLTAEPRAPRPLLAVEDDEEDKGGEERRRRSSSSAWRAAHTAEADVIDVVECGSSSSSASSGDDGLDRLLPMAQQGPAAAAAASAAAAAAAAAGGGGGWAHRGFSSLGGGASGGGGGGGGGKKDDDDGSSNADSWGTTRQSAAEIARRIADSNAAADAELAAAGAPNSPDSPDATERSTDHLDELLSDPAFAASLGGGAGGDGPGDPVEALKADLLAMDEIFEVVAQVPWMDGEELDDAELRGVVAVGLLGTLEEVGFAALRGRVRRVWAGERDVALLSEGAEPREAAALLSVLYHTRRLEERHGSASARGVEAAVKAADAAEVDVGKASALAAALEASGERTGKK